MKSKAKEYKKRNVLKNKLIRHILKNSTSIIEEIHTKNGGLGYPKKSAMFLNRAIYTYKITHDFFKRFDIPDDLFAIRTACDQAEKILEIIVLLGREEDVVITERWQTIIAIFKLNIVAVKITMLSDNYYVDDVSGHNSATGQLTTHPLHGAIRVGVMNEDDVIRYYHLQAHLHMSWPVLIKLGVSHGFLSNFGAAVRALADESHLEILRALPDDICTQISYKRKLIKVYKNRKVAAAGKKFLDYIIHAFDIEDGTKKFRGATQGNKHGNHYGGGKIHGVLPRRMLVDSINLVDITTEEIDEVTRINIKVDKKDRIDEVNYNLAADDLSYDYELYKVKFNKDKFINIDSKKQAISMSLELNWIHKYQQMLPTDNNQLCIYEVAALICELTNSWKEYKKEGLYNEARIVLIIILILFYGRTIDEILNMRVYDKAREDLVNDVNISYLLDENIFLTRPFVPKVSWSLMKKEKNDAIPVQPCLQLGSSCGVDEVIRFLWSEENKKHKGGKLFVNVDNVLAKKAVNVFLNKVNQKHITSLTIIKIYKNAHQEITRVSGDAVDSGLITGQNDARQASQPSYTARTWTALSEVHSKFIDKIIVDSNY